jgi:uncharacterized protein YcbX
MTDGAVVSLWRYPVKSMMGEELNASDLTDRGLLGDRSLALRLAVTTCGRQRFNRRGGLVACLSFEASTPDSRRCS